MNALLLCAGYGNRLKPLTENVPKCLVKIDEKCLLDYWLHALFSSGVKNILVNTHHLSSKVNTFIKNSKFVDRIKIEYEDELLGTASTIKKNFKFFKNQDFFVAHADNLCICNFNDFFRSHFNRPTSTNITMMTFKTLKPQDCGVVIVNKKNIMVEYYEKVKFPKSNLANAAIYLMDKDALKIIKQIKKNNLNISNDIIPQFIRKTFTWHNNVYNRDIGDLKSLKLARQEIKSYREEIHKLKWF